jgi:hypothetical protein
VQVLDAHFTFTSYMVITHHRCILRQINYEQAVFAMEKKDMLSLRESNSSFMTNC